MTENFSESVAEVINEVEVDKDFTPDELKMIDEIADFLLDDDDIKN